MFFATYVFIGTNTFRYLGSAFAMLFVPYIDGYLGPRAEYKVSGLLALAWLAMWSKLGSDRPEDSSNSSSNHGGVGTPLLADEEGVVPALPFHKKEDPALLSSSSTEMEGPAILGRKKAGTGGTGGSAGGIPWGVLIRSSAVWAIVTNNFAFHYATYVLMSWLPTYFQSHIGVPLTEMSSLYTVRHSTTLHSYCSMCYLPTRRAAHLLKL